jgi:hypothetical protein
MIDVMSTGVGPILRRTKMLSDALIWIDSVDGTVRRLILFLIQNEQLRKEGIDETGEVIGYYSELTQILSGGRKKFNTHYTLEDTGEFFRQMFVITLADSLVIDSDGADKDNGENLFKKYGEGIIGLTDENMDKLVAVLREKYYQNTREVLGIN